MPMPEPGPASRRRATAGPSTSRTEAPTLLAGKYRLTRRLGTGGTGAAFLARDLRLERDVAVKTLTGVSVQRLMGLKPEAWAMTTVNHPAIAHVYGIESWRSRPFLVVELLPGGTLADRLRRGPVPAARAVDVAVLLADALAALHGAGYMHGDIKPSNVGFTSDGSPKLLDFGLARETGDVATRGGTVRYLSPEVLSGRPADEGDDVWSLCVMLHEIASGEHPFAGNEVDEVDDRIRRQRLGRAGGATAGPDASSALIEFTASVLDRPPVGSPDHRPGLRRLRFTVFAGGSERPLRRALRISRGCGLFGSSSTDVSSLCKVEKPPGCAVSPQTRRPSARWLAERRVRRGGLQTGVGRIARPAGSGGVIRFPRSPSKEQETSDAIRQAHRRSAHRVGARGRRRAPQRLALPSGGSSLLAAAPQDPSAGRGVAGTPTAHPAADSAGTPQRGLRRRYTGRPVRPADARRDSGVAAVAGSVTDGVPERRGSGASANGCRTAASSAPGASPPPQAVAADAPTASSAGATPASTPAETDPSPASPATVAVEEADPQNAAETNTQPSTARP